MRILSATAACLALASVPVSAQPYLVANRLFPEELRVLGIAGLAPEGCESGSAQCSNIVIHGVIERVGYLPDDDFPNLLRVRDTKTGARYSIQFPYEDIWDNIGTADTSWIAEWPKVGMRVVIIGTISGSAAVVTIDSIYDASFLEGK
jgi:hypothetical protein